LIRSVAALTVSSRLGHSQGQNSVPAFQCFCSHQHSRRASRVRGVFFENYLTQK